ncbi:MFS transporter [Humidisolicoccus flavus]|uniref:MFS transporter n=1 Tax=Humidisolicoccus flavus TaxID=3111414 RepID=UPI0032487DDE
MLALLVIAYAIFVNITVEILPMGLVLPMSRDLGVSESSIGLLVSVFAFTVVISSTTLISLTKRVPRHLLVIIVLIAFSITCIGTALAPNYPIMIALRVLGGLAHGVFWTVVGAYAAYLVPKEQLGRAVAITSAGGSLAFVLGLPVATLLGQTIGWRASFGLFGVACAIGAFLVWRLLPRVNHLAHLATTETGSVAIPKRDPSASVRGVVFAVLATAIAMTGQYAFYTYVSPYLVNVAGVPEPMLSPALLAYGLMGALSLLIMSLWVGRWPFLGAVGCLLVILMAMPTLLFSDSIGLTLIALLAWGFAMGALPPLLQTRLLHASPPHLLQTATAWYTTGFNLGIGGGSLVGAFVLDNAGADMLPYVLLTAAIVALAMLLLDRLLLRRDFRIDARDHAERI